MLASLFALPQPLTAMWGIEIRLPQKSSEQLQTDRPATCQNTETLNWGEMRGYFWTKKKIVATKIHRISRNKYESNV